MTETKYDYTRGDETYSQSRMPSWSERRGSAG